jgi:hypothetical protein
MIMRGNQITRPDDPLQAATLEQLFKNTLEPRAELQALIRQLRIVKTIDTAKYRRLKTQLPYIVCGTYTPPYRRTENFAHIECFVLDLDHLADKELEIGLLRKNLITDPRLAMIFVSPGNDGLKLVFRLTERCHDAGKYKLFYKAFAYKFAAQYGLHQVLDERTSDVTRACFLSHDPEAWYNPTPETIDMKSFVDFDDMLAVNQLLKENRDADRAEKSRQKSEQPLPGDDVLAEIKSKLSPEYARKKEKQIFVPEELTSLHDRVILALQGFPIAIKQIENIHYGKKVLFEAGNHLAEVNVFYGKKGYSIVVTSKTGTNSELGNLCRQILCEILL